MIISQKKSIRLQTLKGRDIPNEQLFDLSEFDKKEHRDTLRKVLTGSLGSTVRTEISPVYNCHGMVFAARRTAIFESQEVLNIINDDMYTEILSTDIIPGDIVLYFSDRGDVEHSGIVIDIRGEGIKIPFVMSKWGRSCEVIHNVYSCPYDSKNIKYYRIKHGCPVPR